jgi:ribosomal protein S1
LEKNEVGNVIKGDVISLNSSNCYVDSENSLTALIGVKDLIVVNTDDAVLICDNQSTQDVKKVVEILKRNKREEAFFHKKVFRPWDGIKM